MCAVLPPTISCAVLSRMTVFACHWCVPSADSVCKGSRQLPQRYQTAVQPPVVVVVEELQQPAHCYMHLTLNAEVPFLTWAACCMMS